MSRLERDIIRDALLDRAEDLFRDLLGEPHHAASADWRTRSTPETSMAMRGEKRGQWLTFATGEKGDVLDLVAVRLCGLSKAAEDFPAVLEAAARWAGLSVGAVDRSELERRRIERDHKAAAEAAADAARKAETVADIRIKAKPIEGTPAAAYLASRGITTWPEGSVAYLEGNPAALIVWARDDAGQIVGGQRIYVTEAGKRAAGADGAKLPKKGFGSIGGFPARLDGPLPEAALYVAEGPETALSVWSATGADVWAVFGWTGFKAAPLPLDRPVVLCPDQDAPNGPAAKGFEDAVAHHLARGVNVWVAIAPEPEGSKADLNDTHQRAGLEAVTEALRCAVKRSAPIVAHVGVSGPVAPLRPAEALPEPLEVGIARARLRSEVRDGLRRQGVTLIEATLGLGKTHATIAELEDRLAEAREAGIDEPVAVIAVPMHRLGRQVLEDIKAAAPSLSVVQLYGAEALDPDNPAETVCKRLDEYKDRAAHLLDMEPLCGACPFAATCLHITSKAERADIYIASHERLKASKSPVKKGQTLVATVVDENPQSALVNVSRRAVPLAAMMAAPFTIRTKAGEQKRIEAEADLRAFRARLEKTILKHGVGDLRLADLSGWTVAEAKAAAALEWKRKIEDDADPNVKGNKTLPTVTGIYAEIVRSLEGQIEVNARVHIREGEMGLECVLRGLKPITAAYRKAPVLMLDATADAEIAGKLAGADLAHHATIRARENILIEQDPLLSGAKSYFFGDGKPTGNVARVRRYIEMQGQTSRTVAIGNKDTIAAMGLPDHIPTAHFNALRGLNDFAEAETLVIVGRTLPPAGAISDLVAAIYGTPCEGTINPDGRVWRLVTHEGAVMRAETKAATHEDPRAERLLAMIRDAEVAQAVGRLRAVNRAEPVRCVILSDAVVDYPVQLVDIRATVRACGIVGAMLEHGGVAFLSPSQASAAYPDIYASKQAAARVLDRMSDTATFSIKALYGKGCPVVSLKRPRAKEAGLALISPSVVDIEAKIKALIPDAQIVSIERPEAQPEQLPEAVADTFASVGAVAAGMLENLTPVPVVDIREVRNARADIWVEEHFQKAFALAEKIRKARRKAAEDPPPPSVRGVAAVGGVGPVTVSVPIPEPRLVWMLEAKLKPKPLPHVLRRYAVTDAGVVRVWDRAVEDIARAGAALVEVSVARWQSMTEADPEAWA